MKIRTFNDFKNLKKGTWVEDNTGTENPNVTFSDIKGAEII